MLIEMPLHPPAPVDLLLSNSPHGQVKPLKLLLFIFKAWRLSIAFINSPL